jgi:transcriptional regulator with XRE-family HTH domain
VWQEHLLLKDARARAGLSQRQLSFPGCSPAYISRIEAGDRIPSLQLLREMGRCLGVSEDYLATGRERALVEADELVAAEVAMRLDDRETAQRLFAEALEHEGRWRASRGRTQPGRHRVGAEPPHTGLKGFGRTAEMESGNVQGGTW